MKSDTNQNQIDVDELIEGHLDNVDKAAWRYYRMVQSKGMCAVSVDDLRSAGYEGLVQAAKHYKPGGKASFSTYAYFWINHAIGKELFFYLGRDALLIDEEMEKYLQAEGQGVEDAAMAVPDISDISPKEQETIIRRKLKEFGLTSEEAEVFLAMKGIGREKVTNMRMLAREVGVRELEIHRLYQRAEEKCRRAY